MNVHVPAGAILIIALATANAAAAERQGSGAAPNQDVGARIRTSSATLASAIEDASRSSPTFRRLVDTIQTTDGIVYIEEGRCRSQVAACLSFGAVARANRILRVVVDPRARGDRLIGLIGHELQHAVEVLGTPAVTSDTHLYFFYLREGRRSGLSGSSIFETDAAIETGHAIRAEVRQDARLSTRRAPPAAPDPGVIVVTRPE